MSSIHEHKLGATKAALRQTKYMKCKVRKGGRGRASGGCSQLEVLSSIGDKRCRQLITKRKENKGVGEERAWTKKKATGVGGGWMKAGIVVSREAGIKEGEETGHQESNLKLHSNEKCSCTSAPRRSPIEKFIANTIQENSLRTSSLTACSPQGCSKH
jgi:hypothetical protein